MHGPGLGSYHCTFPRAFQPTVALLDDVTEVMVKGELEDPDVPGTFLLLVQSSADEPFVRGSLSQHTAAATPQELDRKFPDCGYPIWNRDDRSRSRDIFAWPAFLEQVPDAPSVPPLQLDLGSVEAWRRALHKMRPGRATRVCGCAVDELRSMPESVLCDLVGSRESWSWGGSLSVFVRAQQAAFQKIESLQSMSDCRPITVCATIYRLFATVITRQVLDQWAKWLPEGLKGAIPGRSSRDTALGIELAVEQALLRKASLMGLSLDLKKFFNKIPRPPILFLLSHMGLPDTILSVWGDFLERGFRLPSIRGHLGVPIPSMNGVFEGDPLSILAQAAINWHMFHFTLDPDLSTHSFVDNWAWVTGVRFSFGRVLNMVQTFCGALSLEKSWSKSFAWATRAEDRAWIRQVVGKLLPSGEGLVVVMAAQDLGIAFRYRVRLGRGTSEARRAEGRQRWPVSTVLRHI